MNEGKLVYHLKGPILGSVTTRRIFGTSGVVLSGFGRCVLLDIGLCGWSGIYLLIFFAFHCSSCKCLDFAVVLKCRVDKQEVDKFGSVAARKDEVTLWNGFISRMKRCARTPRSECWSAFRTAYVTKRTIAHYRQTVRIDCSRRG